MLSSLTKLANYAGLSIVAGQNVLENRRALLGWQAALSDAIEIHCGRNFIIESRTEDFDTEYHRTVYFPKSLPIASITSVKSDSLGQYDGSETTLDADDYRIGVDGMSLVLDYPVLQARKGLRVVLTGGLAYHEVQSVFAATVTGSPTVGYYAIGSLSNAVGIVKAASASAITLENLYGVFRVNDVLSFATTESALHDSTKLLGSLSATITGITQQSLAEAYPGLERAVEIETRHAAKHQHDFENVSTMEGQTQRRQSTVWQTPYIFQPETLSLLSRYRVVHL